MQIKNLISLFYDSANSIDLNFGTGTIYHLHQAIKNDEVFTDPPFVYLFRPILLESDISEQYLPVISTYTLPFVYFHTVDPKDNINDYEEAQAAGEIVVRTFLNEIDKNDFISIDGYNIEGGVKFFDGYIVTKFGISLSAPNDFDYCSLNDDVTGFELGFEFPMV